MTRFKDRVALITGAGRVGGIGFAVGRQLVEEGASVVLVDRDESALEKAATTLGRSATSFAADVSDRAQMVELFDQVAEKFGRLDVLVNNAGITQSRRTVDISDEDWDRVLNINLRGSLIASQLAIPLMPRGASIVCIASIAGQRGGGFMGGPHYAASKAGVAGLSRAMARDLARDGIRVNAVNPGIIMTDMTHDFYDEEKTAAVMPNILLDRFGRPEDVANACLFLASDQAAYITGTCVDVNGGLHMN